MISLEKFQLIRERYGHFASWAVWAEPGKKPKDNVADLSVLDPQLNPALLELLNGDFVFLGLNISRGIEQPFGNFHDPRPMAMDYKIRFALQGTRFWGSYMTDIIKDFEERASGKTLSYLSANRSFEKQNIAILRDEIADLGTTNPVLIAFGKDAERIARRNLGAEYGVVGIPHYAVYGSHEDYRKKLSETLYQLL